jgi:hypothetical protein
MTESIKIRMASGDVIDLAEVREKSLATIERIAIQHAARSLGAPHAIGSPANEYGSAQLNIALLDALEAALGVPKETGKYAATHNAAIDAVRQAAGVVE